MNKYTDDEMLDELRRVASVVDGPLSRPKFIKVGRISASAVTTRFGGWIAAIEAAGIEPAYRYGGIWFDCPVCGSRFRSDNGAKSRRTCSRECSGLLMSRRRSKGRDASLQAARGRGRYRVDVDECARCGHDGSDKRLEVHHIDGDPYNNAMGNLEVLCTTCHKAHHVRVRARKKKQPAGIS